MVQGQEGVCHHASELGHQCFSFQPAWASALFPIGDNKLSLPCVAGRSGCTAAQGKQIALETQMAMGHGGWFWYLFGGKTQLLSLMSVCQDGFLTETLTFPPRVSVCLNFGELSPLPCP